MIAYVYGDLFESPAPVLVNTVNLVGVMGKGIAKDFKTYFPDMFEDYQRMCESGGLEIGTLHLWRGGEGKAVLNFPTKRHWRAKSKIEDIEAGLKTFVDRYRDFSIQAIAFPQLGCGNGELDWESQVQPLMERYLDPLPIDVSIYLYDGDRTFVEHRQREDMYRWLRESPRALPFVEFMEDVRRVATETDVNPVPGWSISVCIGVENEDVVEFVNLREPGVFSLHEHDLNAIWNQLKTTGYAQLASLPSRISSPLAEMLIRIEYLGLARTVNVSSSENELILALAIVPSGGELRVSSTQLAIAGV